MWRFESPDHLIWLLAAPGVMALFYFYYRRWQIVSKRSFGERVVPYLIQNFSAQKAFIKAVCMSLALVFFVLAWARPQMGKGQAEVKSEGVEIMILLDVSNSMLAEDVRPSRLEHAKKEIIKLLDMMSGDKVGLIAFAGSAVLLSPLTPDKAALKMFIEGISPNAVETQGTEIGKALEEAKDAFMGGGVEASDKARVTKVALVISDGEDHEPGTEKIAKDLTDNGIRIFTMAFGTEAGGKIALRDNRGTLRDYLKDKQGQVVVSKVKGDFLRSLASLGQGSFYHVTFGGNQMNALKEDLDQLEKAEFDTMIAASYEEQFQWFLIVGIIFAVIDLILGNRKKIPAIWKGRFPV